MTQQEHLDKMLLAEARALLIQMFARGDYEYKGTTQNQVERLCQKIAQSIGY